MSILTTQMRENRAKSSLLLAAVLFFLSTTVMAQEKAPERGFRPAGSYALSDIETISTTSGNMMLKVPLAALPAGRGGLSVSLNLIYNSKLYDSFPASTQINNSYYDVTNLKQSQAGGWRYGYKYELYGEGRYGGHNEMGEINSCDSTPYTAKLSLLTPDGGKHELRLAGHTDGDGFQDVWQDGTPACSGRPGATGTLSYYTTDGTFLRLDVEHDYDEPPNPWNNPWTLYLPDGGRVTGGASPQRIYDRNNNYIEIVNGSYNGHSAVYFNDQIGRTVILEYESATNQDSIHVRGVANELLTTTVAWTNVEVHKSYTREVGTPFNLPATWRSVSQITLPSQAGSLSYSFGYNANGSNPTVGWGEMSSITLPSGAISTYNYLQDNQNTINFNLVLQNRPTQKQLAYSAEYDQTQTPITETWNYGMTYADPDTAISSTITGPDGGVTTENFNKDEEDGRLTQSGLVYKSVAPDGTVSERSWQVNIPNGTPVLGGAFYAKYEFTSIPNASGVLTQTAIRESSYDKNGNVTRIAAYDWVPYESVPRNAQGRPDAPPSGVQPKTVTVNTYYNPTPVASDTTYDADAFQVASSPRLHRTLESSEVQTSSGTAMSRTEAFYDNTSAAGAVTYTIGNLTQQKSWDSTKAAYINPLVAGNSISISNTYDAYGNLLTSTDARGVATTYCYSTGDCAIGGQVANLYPTRIRIASNYSTLMRTTNKEYEYYTGVVTRVVDADNNIAVSTTYDVFGRPTLVKAAETKDEETWTATVYSDTNRRVIVRSDLAVKGDGKLVSIRHYDQLGRIRLARQLEDAGQDPENETQGIKVQMRYIICPPTSTAQCPNSNSTTAGTYQIVSNAYRAATSGAASGETSMGWTRSKSDISGRLVEATTFGGASTSWPWGSNTSITGTVTTAYDANLTTVTDQSLRMRRSMMNGLGQLARVDEPSDPNVNDSLGTTGNPAQPTSYTYDSLGNLVTVTQGTQTPRSFNYSSLSRLNSATNPESGMVNYLYDNNGNLTRKTDARLIYIDYVYDALNRNTTADYSNTTVNPDITRAYDNLTAGANGKGRFWKSYAGGNDATGSNVEQTAVDSYDALGRPLIQRQLFKLNGTWAPAYETQRSYNLAGGVTLQTYPSTKTVSYGYDNAGRTNAFTGDLGYSQTNYATAMTYSASGGMTNEQFGTDTGIYHKLEYNVRGQLWDTRVGTGLSGNSDWNRGALQFFYSQPYSYIGGSGPDNNGNVLASKHYRPLDELSSTYTISTDYYLYDSLNRLASVSEKYEATAQPSPTPQFQQSYVYDRYGNRTINQGGTWGNGINTMQAAVVPNTMTNRLYAPGETEQNHPLINYDDAGNQTKDYYSVPSVSYDRVYDAENRMTSTTSTGNHASSYTYNADGQRVRRKIDGTETWQVYAMDGELLAEYGQNGSPLSPQKEFGYRNGQLLVEVTAAGSWGSPPTFTPPATLVAGMEIKVEHLTELRTAVDQLRVKAGVGTTTWIPDPTPLGGVTFIKADHILQLRTKLEEALIALHLPTGGYANPGLAATTSFIYAIDFQELRKQVLDAWTSGSALKINWMVADQLGTPRIIIDKTGALANVKRHDYLPFGEELTTQGLRNTMPGYSGDDIRQKFTSKERDNETGLDYFLARYYASTQGRFTGADPLLSSGHPSDPQSWNRFTYAANNPLRYIDPLGLYIFDGHVSPEQQNAFNSSLDQARKNLKAYGQKYGTESKEYKKAARALEAYGEKGINNGVTVGAAEGAGAGRVEPGRSKQVNVNFDSSAFETGTFGDLIGHEGSHIADKRDWIDSGFKNSFNPTEYQTEFDAFTVQGMLAQARHLDEPAGPLNRSYVSLPPALLPGRKGSNPTLYTREQVNLWNSSWAPADIGTMRGKGINTILARPKNAGGDYEMLPTDKKKAF